MTKMENGVYDNSHFFEGVEKLMEIWFTRKDGKDEYCDVRNIPREKWEEILRVVNCEIISFSQNKWIDAYVLSESSLFVSKRRLILKTCGTTLPLLCIKPLLQLVTQYAGFDKVEDLFYSHKNFRRPELQKTPHRSFASEIEMLDVIFKGGSAYCLGTINEDCWYLYTLNPLKSEWLSPTWDKTSEPDQTLEILMTGLDEEVMKIFTKESCKTADEATKKSGIDQIFPNVAIDGYLFEPCGYSMNGIMKNGYYMTIHITPEPEFSYVSFETNVPKSSYKDTIQKVIEIFQPSKFSVTVISNEESVAGSSHRELELSRRFSDWLRFDMQFCFFKNYALTYAHYAKFPS